MATATPADVGTATLLRAAIAERRLVTFTFDGFQRKAEPHDYGILDGVPTLFFWQVRSAKKRFNRTANQFIATGPIQRVKCTSMDFLRIRLKKHRPN